MAEERERRCPRGLNSGPGDASADARVRAAKPEADHREVRRGVWFSEGEPMVERFRQTILG